MRERIGFIGLGNVGGKLAGNLLANGVDLTVRDLDRTAALLPKAEALWRGAPFEGIDGNAVLDAEIQRILDLGVELLAGDGTLHLYFSTGGVASTTGTPCIDGDGDEVCAVDVTSILTLKR